jgi:hypothetical protein
MSRPISRTIFPRPCPVANLAVCLRRLGQRKGLPEVQADMASRVEVRHLGESLGISLEGGQADAEVCGAVMVDERDLAGVSSRTFGFPGW